MSQLDAARAELETPYGRASSAWAKQSGKLTMDVVVPPNTTATIEFPGSRKPETVTAGTYHFELQVVALKGDAGGKRFDGIGVVNGGGATSVVLKD